MERPPRDQLATPSSAGWSVRRFGRPPFALMTYTSKFPPALESNTIRAPSGDQRGHPVMAAPRDVNCKAPDPSLPQTQTSSCPERSEVNVILVPSGEYCGTCSLRVEAINLTALSALMFGPERSRRQMFASFAYSRLKASRFP